MRVLPPSFPTWLEAPAIAGGSPFGAPFGKVQVGLGVGKHLPGRRCGTVFTRRGEVSLAPETWREGSSMGGKPRNSIEGQTLMPLSLSKDIYIYTWNPGITHVWTGKEGKRPYLGSWSYRVSTAQ